ncbi:theronine dehydrogenase [Paenibacillus psychroresistens]|uniref:Theronine dehydrogenase n=1 Tax=Paenibacillus psychroresistens TaxID=1778678 RepID=A0A6B8RGF6_9BACL|nr:zinc-dependent alcohol dehydrogenase family protein [Paenibacillus psychroresistens]QGQ94602.1 theronine dehydrogenase [Paenibacillus psychroresistens]
MQAAVWKGKHQIEVLEWRMQELLPNEVRVQVKCCGICGTDQHIYHGHPGSAVVTPPIVLGHELSGEVTEIGENVFDLRVGDRISIDPNIYCGACEFCRSGRAHLCDHLQAVGVTRDGGMSEFCVAPAANCYKIPDTMSYAEGALIEPLGCVLHGFKKLDIRANSSVLIIGGGFIGQLFLQLFKQHGAAKIVVSEPNESKHERLLQLGAHVVVKPVLGSLASLVMADIVIECVGQRESMELAVSSVRKGGQVLLFGVSSPDTQIAISPYEIFSKELKIMGSFINPHTHEEAIALVSQGIIQVESLVGHRFYLDDIPEVMENYSQMNVGKSIIQFERKTEGFAGF